MSTESTEQATPGGVNVRLLVVIGVVSSLLLIEIVVGLQAYYYNTQASELVRKDLSQPDWGLSNLLLDQQAELQSYRWVDKKAGTVAIPIDRAIAQFVRRQRQGSSPQASHPRPADRE